MKNCKTIDLGLIGYREAAALQQRLVAARKLAAVPDLLLFCEHPHVITLGRNGKRENLRVSEDLLSRQGVEFHHTNRGGDITYHGPGQIVGYPILDLNGIRRDVVWYVRQLEQCMIQATSSFGIEAFRVPGCTGVWVQPWCFGRRSFAPQRKARLHRRAHQPLGHVSRICLQCLHRSALFRSHHALRHRRLPRHFA